jgi:hypothetical protein
MQTWNDMQVDVNTLNMAELLALRFGLEGIELACAIIPLEFLQIGKTN